MYQLLQWAYLSLQLGVSGYNAIYGSFAALPLLVIWLQIVWMLVLFGCQVAFFLQNYESYRNNNRFADLSFFLQKLIALQITHLIVKNFVHFDKPLTAADMAVKLLIPLAAIQAVLVKLLASRIIVELKVDEEDEVYLPAVDTNKLTLVFVMNALEQCGQNDLPVEGHKSLFKETLNHFRQLMVAAEQNRLLKDIED